jgi:hypothetical protein
VNNFHPTGKRPNTEVITSEPVRTAPWKHDRELAAIRRCA